MSYGVKETWELFSLWDRVKFWASLWASILSGSQRYIFLVYFDQLGGSYGVILFDKIYDLIRFIAFGLGDF